MKLICINNNWNGLSVGKIYQRVSDEESALGPGYYHIYNDNGEPGVYPVDYFKRIDEIRDEKLNQILGK
jgi:hypothetical protein